MDLHSQEVQLKQMKRQKNMKKTSVKVLERQDLQYIGTNCFGYVGRGYPKPLCILFSDTKGIQWGDTDATL